MATAAYCVYTDIQNIVGVKSLVELTSDTANEETTYDSTVLAAIIAQADRQIDSKAGQVYKTPFIAGTNCTTVPSMVSYISARLTCYYLFARRYSSLDMPQMWKDIYKDMMQALDDISNQLVELDGSPTIASQEANISAPDKQADFYNADSAWSQFG